MNTKEKGNLCPFFNSEKKITWYDLEVETFASRISFLKGDYFVLACALMSSLHPHRLETDLLTSTLFQGLIASTSSLGWPPSLFVWLSSASVTCSGPIPSSANVAKSVKARWRWTSTVTSMGRTAGGRMEKENMGTGIKYMFKTPMTIMVLKCPRLKKPTEKIKCKTLPLWLLQA